jgi:DNA-directed RNA polymerase subunit E'/Rpb7
MENTNIYFRSILRKKIIVDAKYLNERIDDYIHEYLKNKMEGKCIDEGYVKPESVRIIKRSAGVLLGSRFTGDITYEVAYTADLCNPYEGNIYDCKVKFKTKAGIMGYNGPLSFIVGKQFHENEIDAFESIKVGDMIKVYVLGKSFSVNDKEIQVVGKIHGIENKKNKKMGKKENVVEMIKNETMKMEDNSEDEDENEMDDIELSDDESEDGSEDGDEEEEDESGSEESGSEGSESEEEEEEDKGEKTKVGGNTILKDDEFGDDFSDYGGDDADDDADGGGDDDDDGYYSD